MRQILLFIIVGLTCNVMAQKPHKATGDKPLYSKSFEMYGNNDSIYDNATVYAYNTAQRIVKSINYYTEDSDSTLYQYDQNDRVTSIKVYSDNELIGSTIWVYYDAESRIENYILEERMQTFLDTAIHTVYYGVKDMNAIGESMMLLGMDIIMRDCDSIIMFMNISDDGSQQQQVLAIYPVYQDGYPSTAVMNINSDLLATIDLDMALDISINLTFTYQNQKLMTIKGSTTLDLSAIGIPIPVPLSNFFTITNQYTGDLLSEMKSEINVTVLFQEIFYTGIKTNYLYNSEENKICDVLYSSREKNSWNLESKIWYYYENPVEDIALHSMIPSGNEKDNEGAEMKIFVNLENSGFTPYANVSITAKITSSSGDEETISETISLINPFVSKTYQFSTTYTVPNDSSYTITVYIDNKDNNTSNDTLSVVRLVHLNLGVSPIESNTLSMSQNFPNPAKSKTIINYSIPQDGEINLTIFSITGQLIYNKRENASLGKHQIDLDLSDYASGIYFYTMEYKGQRITKRMSIKR